MCGRFSVGVPREDLIDEFGVSEPPFDIRPRYNLAPSQIAPVVLRGDDGALSLAGFRWGLVPFWAHDEAMGNRLINARAESLDRRPAFRWAFRQRRCLVPADGWYEWQKSPTGKDAKGKPRKQPFYMHPVPGEDIAFAGIYEFWRDKAVHGDDPQAWLTTFCIITVDAIPGLDAIHDRMPLALSRDRWEAWLDPDLDDADGVRALLVPPPPGLIIPEAVSTRVNVVSNNGPDLVEPVPLTSLHGVVDPATGEVVGAGDAPLF